MLPLTPSLADCCEWEQNVEIPNQVKRSFRLAGDQSTLIVVLEPCAAYFPCVFS